MSSAAPPHSEARQGAWPPPPSAEVGPLPTAARNAAAAPASQSSEFGFADLLDIINPLQHIPIVSHIYRALTGDEIEGPARIAGGLLFGGPVGFVTSLFDTVVAEATGASAMGHVVAALRQDGGAGPRETVVAAAPQAQFPGPAGGGPQGPHTRNRWPGPARSGTPPPAQMAASAPAPVMAHGAVAPPAGDDGRGAFARRMMHGLDRYESLLREAGGGRIDETL